MFKWLFKRRPPERRKVDIATTAHDDGGPEFQVRFVNLSAHGFRLKGSDRFREGSHLSIMLPGYGEVVGRVIWVIGEECGGMFLTPIPIDRLQFIDATA
jgi:hypothetical protein